MISGLGDAQSVVLLEVNAVDHGLKVSYCVCYFMEILYGPLQINFLFPFLTSTIFACGRAVHFHYCIIKLAAFTAWYSCTKAIRTCKKLHKSMLLPYKLEVCADLIALLTHEVKLSSQNARITGK